MLLNGENEESINQKLRRVILMLIHLVIAIAMAALLFMNGVEEVLADVNSEVKHSTVIESDSRANSMGLSSEEMSRYETIMSGPRGLWSPGLDPITALGVYARDAEERKHYAKIAAIQELDRVGKELAFQKAYDIEIRKLTVNQTAFDMDVIRSSKNSGDQTLPGDRILYFVSLDCKECDVTVTKLVDRVKKGDRLSLDIYIVGADTSKDEIQEWAARIAIPRQLVGSRVVTINRDNGVLSGYGEYDPPMLMRLSNGSISNVSLLDVGL